MDILGEGHDEQRKRVKKRMVTGVKVIRVEKKYMGGGDGWAVPLTTWEGFTEVTFYQDHCSMGCSGGHKAGGED